MAGVNEQLNVGGPLVVSRHGGEGRPILLIHGLGGSHVNWSAVADRLAAAGSVTAVDLPGFGLTPPSGRPSTVTANRDLVLHLLAQLGPEPATLIGNSMGGLISMLVARAAPERVHSLVLVGTALPMGRPRVSARGLTRVVAPALPLIGPRLLGRMRGTDPSKIVDQTISFLFADPSRLRPEDRALAVDMARQRLDLPWAGKAFSEASRSMIPVLADRRRFARRVATITAPALIVHGDRDPLVPADSARWLNAQRPDWQFELLRGVGHVPQLEVPDRFVELVLPFLQLTQTKAHAHAAQPEQS